MHTTVIRKAVFETNSSSMHSITISDKKGLMEILHLEKDNITLLVDCNYDFSWGEEVYANAAAKIAYCVLDHVDNTLLEQALKEQTGAKVIHYKNEDSGYIDHQSIGTTADKLTSVQLVKNFIFNPNSVLEIDNDNH